MKKFRKRPVIIEAVQWFKPGDHPAVIINPLNNPMTPDDAQIETLEGWLHVSVGDWIIKGVQGELYPCKPEIFQQTYEEVL